MKLIGLSGKSGAGKDAVATMLGEHGWKRLAFADKLKEIALEVDPLMHVDVHGSSRVGMHLASLVRAYGWDASKRSVPEARRFLQGLGVALRNVDPDFWVNLVMDQIDWCSDDLYVITDVRFLNEFQAVRRVEGGTVVRVVRPEAGLEDPTLALHSSETE